MAPPGWMWIACDSDHPQPRALTGSRGGRKFFKVQAKRTKKAPSKLAFMSGLIITLPTLGNKKSMPTC